jgi:hypothetical protein
MNAYLFSGVTNCSQLREDPRHPGAGKSWQTWAALSMQIIQAATPEEAQTRFEAPLHAPPEGEDPVDMKIVKISGAQFVEYLLTESSNVPLDLPAIAKEAQAQLEATAVDDFEQGYWVEVDPVVSPVELSQSVDALRAALPEDIRSGLNWAPEKQFLFMLTALTPWSPDAGAGWDPDAEPPSEETGEAGENDEAEHLGEWYATYPQMRDKEAAALIRARNSVVAAWLWRRYAAGTRLAANPIRIDPWCGVMPAA